MSHVLDPITEHDLDAYVDDQLAMPRRIEEEAHLGRHPDAAARVMADLRMRDELRLSLSEPPRSRSFETLDAARRLQRGLGRARRLRRRRAVS